MSQEAREFEPKRVRARIRVEIEPTGYGSDELLRVERETVVELQPEPMKHVIGNRLDQIHEEVRQQIDLLPEAENERRRRVEFERREDERRES